MTIVCDLIGSTVEYMVEERKAESLEGYYRQFTLEQLEQIKAVAIDRWQPNFKAPLKHVPGAAEKIVHDRFHIVKHVGEAVDRVRKQEHRELLVQEVHRLNGTKNLWLYREENVSDKHRPALEALKAANLKVAKAWVMKESLNDVLKYLRSGWARRFVSDGLCG